MTSLPPHPEKIGRYPVERLLGRGAMGAVYLARDTELDRDVAIKVVRNAGSAEEQAAFLVRFRNEAKAVGRLRHRSVVAVHDVGVDAELGPFLVFEFVEGANLKDILRSRGALSPEQVLMLAEQVGAALEVAHREGIIHRDIKPENLLMGSDGLIRLADFGVARVPDAALTGQGQFLGTPCYGAPETLRGGEAGPLSDQFSFAAVLYEAATGTRAFPGNDALSVAHAVIHEAPVPPSRAALPGARVPERLDEVLLRGLQKEPQNRYERLSSLVAALRAAYFESGLVSRAGLLDTLPAVTMAEPTPAAVPAAKKPLTLWPFLAALLLGLAVVYRFAPDEAVEVAVAEAPLPLAAAVGEPVVAETPRGPAEPALVQDAVVPSEEDARVEALPDPAQAAADTAAELAHLSPFEREERAKDALDRAERALRAGEREQARAALDEAFRYDPDHPDIASLRAKL